MRGWSRFAQPMLRISPHFVRWYLRETSRFALRTLRECPSFFAIKLMAIFGIGIDLVEVGRIKAGMEKFPRRFRARIFTKNEIAFCETRQHKYLSYAARFAAKEAFSKALGTGLRGKISWQDIEVVDNELSKPSIIIKGRAKKILGNRKVQISLAHTIDYATAIVIIED